MKTYIDNPAFGIYVDGDDWEPSREGPLKGGPSRNPEDCLIELIDLKAAERTKTRAGEFLSRDLLMISTKHKKSQAFEQGRLRALERKRELRIERKRQRYLEEIRATEADEEERRKRVFSLNPLRIPMAAQWAGPEE